MYKFWGQYLDFEFLEISILSQQFHIIEKERKSERWMPWLWEAKKDVVSCDKLRVGANDL